MTSQRRRPLKKPTAAIGRLANENTSTQNPSTVSQEVIDRVKKCFARANHDSANETEAKAAAKLASDLMRRYQISQADIMANEVNQQRKNRGGLSTVDIRPAKDGGRAFTPGWVDWLCGAMNSFFDCRCFSTRRVTGFDDRIEWTFYGVAEHTVFAAIAFEAIHNQIQDWSESYVGIPDRNSYCLGISDGLLRLSKDEKKAAEAEARETEAKALAAKIRDEEAEEKFRHSLLQHLSLDDSDTEMDLDEPDDSSDDGNDKAHGAADDASDNEPEVLPDFTEQDDSATTVDTGANLDVELRRFIPNEREKNDSGGSSYLTSNTNVPTSTGSAHKRDKAEEESPTWKSMRQLSLYREQSNSVADDVLKERKLKILKGRKTKRVVKDRDAFKQGQRDSKEINVRAARIERGEDQAMNLSD